MMVNMQRTNDKLKRRCEAMVAKIAHCDPSHAARWLEQAEGDIKTAGLLALGVDRIDAETILKNCDGNLRRVFAKLARDRDRHPKGAAARKQGQAVGPGRQPRLRA